MADTGSSGGGDSDILDDNDTGRKTDDAKSLTLDDNKIRSHS